MGDEWVYIFNYIFIYMYIYIHTYLSLNMHQGPKVDHGHQ